MNQRTLLGMQVGCNNRQAKNRKQDIGAHGELDLMGVTSYAKIGIRIHRLNHSSNTVKREHKPVLCVADAHISTGTNYLFYTCF